MIHAVFESVQMQEAKACTAHLDHAGVHAVESVAGAGADAVGSVAGAAGKGVKATGSAISKGAGKVTGLFKKDKKNDDQPAEKDAGNE